MSAPLPEGWTGNGAVHHRTVGMFHITVFRQPEGYFGTRYGYRIKFGSDKYGGTFEPYQNGHRDAAEARSAAMDKLREFAKEILAAPV